MSSDAGPLPPPGSRPADPPALDAAPAPAPDADASSSTIDPSSGFDSDAPAPTSWSVPEPLEPTEFDLTSTASVPEKQANLGLARTSTARTSTFSINDAGELGSNADFSLDTDVEFVLEAKEATETLVPPSTDRYVIQKRLGTGGMGVVYQAYDSERDEVVALKTMRKIDPKAWYRFKQEFRTLADLSHPNLLNLYELVASGDPWFFTMELVEGTDFISHVRTGPCGPTPPGAALESDQVRRLRQALRQLAEGIAALHEAGKLHRDIKPPNVLVTARGRVVLLDFGLSADLGPSGQHDNVGEPIVGTVAYMSPEQGTAQPVSPASDWYSVGVMLFVALTGSLPFEGRPRAVLARKLEEEPPSPACLAPETPPDLDALCAELLRRDPAARPPGRAILARLAATPVPAVSGTAGVATGIPLIGRERHFAVLRAAFESVRGGHPEAVLVSGRSGSGKSTLLQAFLDEVTARDEAIVLAGRCYERESVPYKALDSVVDALSRYLKPLPRAEARALLPRDISLLARVFPVLLRVEAVSLAPRPEFEIPDQQELRRRAFAALRALLARISQVKPLVVSIDDLQWADPENAPLMADLVRPPEPPLMLLLGSLRSEDIPSSPFLKALLGTDPEETSRLSLQFQELSVGALSMTESRALALALLGHDEPSTQAQAYLIARESQGNPLFIDELVKHLQAGGGLGHRPASAGSVTLDEVLQARIDRLSEDARRLLGIVAVSGRPIAQGLAFQAAGLGAEARAAAGLLRTSRLIRITGPSRDDAIEVYHDRIRETVVAHLPGDILQDHHLHLAEALEASPQAEPESLAVQFQGAGQHHKAGHYFVLAADRAAESLAFDHAARLYRRALELRSAGARDIAVLNRKLGDALANAGRGGAAARAYLAATAGASVAGALELKRRATMQQLISGRVDEGLATLQSLLAALGMALPGGPRRTLAWLIVRRARLWFRGFGFQRRDTSQLSAEMLTRIDLCWSAATGLSIIDPIAGAEFQARGLLLALRAGEPYRVARAVSLETMHVSTAGGRARPRVAALMKQSQELAEEVGHPHALSLVPVAQGTTMLMFGCWRAAREAFDQAESMLRDRCTGVAWELDTVHHLALWATAHMGDIAEIRRRLPTLLQEAQERGDLYAATTLSTYVMTLLRLADDEPEAARRELVAVIDRWSQHGFHLQHSNAFRAHVHIDLYSGASLAAWGRFRHQWAAHRRAQLLRVQTLRIEMLELRGRSALAAAASSPRPGRWLRAAARDARWLDREREPWASAHAQMLRAGIAAVRRDFNRSAELLGAAITQFEAAEMHLNAAAARRRLGELLGGHAGRHLCTQTDEWMTRQTIRNPAGFTRVYAPGFPPSAEPQDEHATMLRHE
jgi:hypothetical protein